MSVRVYRRMLVMLLVFILSVSGVYYILKWQEAELQELQMAVNTDGVHDTFVIPGGMPIGIYLETEGVLILGTEDIKGKNGTNTAPAKNLVKSGDYIVGINEEEISDKRELVAAVKNLDQSSVILHVRRDENYFDIKIKPTQDEEGDYKLGIWVRDNAQGLGTLTYITSDYSFGALGHGIHDVDTNELLEISEGTMYETSIQNIKKGATGTPGGLEGTIIYSNYNILGKIDKNCTCGIFGKISKLDRALQNVNPVPVGIKEELKIGPASILCTVNGQIEEYHIQITGINERAKEVNKGIQIQVDDDRLLKRTGGIIQGMSGSPILQNGKIVGAVTHVLVNDPTRGYGIFIENMLEQ